LTYRELDLLVDKFAIAVEELGVNKGDRVGIYLPNIPQFIIAYYGTLRAGGVVVTCSPLYKERELRHIVNDSEAKILVAWDRLYPYVRSVKEETQLTTIVTTDVASFLSMISKPRAQSIESYDRSSVQNMKDLLEKYEGEPKPVHIQPQDDLALLQYTGGTTGIPKGAMLTHHNLIVNCVQFATWCKMRPEDMHLSILPLSHIYGMTVAMNVPIYTKSTMILIPDPKDTENVLKVIGERKPTIFCGVPTMYLTLLNHPDIRQHNLSSVRLCISGGAPLPGEVQKRFEKLTGGKLLEGYGLSETSPVTHLNRIDKPEKNRPGSIGIPISDTEARIVDLENGKNNLPPGEPGELIIRGPQVMVGYWKNPEENKIALRDGWLYTGDIATIDADGYFYIVDRKKDMINTSGLKVWPREVEEILYEHPAVKEAAVVGVPDARSGEAVKAYVVLKDNYPGEINVEEIMNFCENKIAPYKVPKLIEFRNELPKTPVGKILRRALQT
jgi:long-chain acyl-CoA synthetase